MGLNLSKGHWWC